ncbi:SprT-like family-domain-containing protein [Collybia nuda]|uniref:SprT-like family-domain-containing protein n=1 Tax=Collybia nuda TaxID=64659 RepID=A0A9P5XSI9_9AGAR|nr:SprT-like family-domain-containing protein [Collybia nuda]
MIGCFPEQSSVYKDPKASKELVSPSENQDVQVPLVAELDDIWDSGGAILTLNEPKIARKPIRHKSPRLKNITINTPFLVGSPTPNEETRVTPDDTPSRSRLAEGVPTTPKPNVSPRKARQPPCSSKKAKAAAEQAEREAYAQKLFTELNYVVFKNALPKETKLNWNKRLLTTAGRAKWHRSRDGTQITEIELAEKILDCEERIRNTLSHEMCHLASWLIDDNPKEVHGRLWKAWANRVMRKRPEIEITTRHNYEISYPFEWKCEKCAKIYGRFSNSIRTEECVCGSCKVGKLLPLFLAPSRVPKTPKMSRMAAMKPQDSPHSTPQSPYISHRDIEKDGVILSSRGPVEVYVIHDSDSESDPDIQDLSKAMGSVTFVTRDA